MRTDVDAFLRRLAQELRPRTDESVDVLLQSVRGELPELWQYEDIAVLATKETAAHVTTFLHMLEQGLDATEVAAPSNSLELARRFARSGVPVSTLLRAYRLGHIGLFQLIQAEVPRLTDDPDLINAASTRLMTAGFAYVDRTSERVVLAYQEERDRRLQRRLVMTNDAGRRIGTTLDIRRTAQELADVGIDDFADHVTVDMLVSVLPDDGTHPPSDPPLLRRVAQRSASGDASSLIAPDRTHTYPARSEQARALATGRPELYSAPSADLPAPADGVRSADGVHSALLVPLLARGDTLGLVQFLRDATTAPFDEDDLLIAGEIAARAAVYLDNARRYTHEHTTALTLQRSLLPQHAVEQSAVVAASRYLPSGSRAGVGGDWYDVIPLSGARVALVVGDVVGRGLHASATMGRLRTAVRAFADIDLMPDELLTHLDDVVIRLQHEEGQEAGETSATCLYAVYDPVSRLCSLASAGHVLPAVAGPPAGDDRGLAGGDDRGLPGEGEGVDRDGDGNDPALSDANDRAPSDDDNRPLSDGDGPALPRGDGPALRSVTFPDMPIGPPLGLGGLPFETTQFTLPEGSLLALYTDGLIASRTRDVDEARATLREVLATAPESPDEVCDRLLAALLPTRPADDVALLVARTLTLDPGHVATLDLPSDPAAVSGARRFASATLTAWGLDDLSFTTELVVSELVTNAIRYGQSPIQLRLIRQSTLTCEVFDGSGTAPHLRRARTFDEGGRGLLLVAQCARRWGTRHTREGKVIWAELPLPAEGSAPYDL
ncbi:ATP-binding SpoIIE family protein phosphatase [Streptomyces tritici]|uniref:ATP-binding SpoIIE family protein phosphatase n=1 Tax=Streptomyces tritici TaxID=2054410 RepID=UPI003AF0B3A5